MAVRALARVNLCAIERNVARLAREANGSVVCAVVKADGYGHGMVPCARAALKGGATWRAGGRGGGGGGGGGRGARPARRLGRRRRPDPRPRRAERGGAADGPGRRRRR